MTPGKSNNTQLRNFRWVALAEGISYLLLLFIAMPLKYLMDYPLAVKYVGWAHGLLFIGYMGLLLSCWLTYGWRISRVAFFSFASLVPFLPFVVEKQLKREVMA